MTIDEIKQTVSMREVVRRYGLTPNRAGFIRCPFHEGDRTASLKIYKDSFHCYGCGANGDIFKFVMLMDNLSFKEAFLSLGGTYEHDESRDKASARKQAIKEANAKRARKKAQDLANRKRILYLAKEIDAYRFLLRAYKPLSDPWCECMRGYEKSLFEYDQLREEVEN